MKSVARIALVKGMEISEDIRNSQGDIIISAHTKVDEKVLAKLERFSIMVVSIMEDIDYATTHYERVQLSQDFKNFLYKYQIALKEYKQIMNLFVIAKVPVDLGFLLGLYHTLTDSISNSNLILDYLYNMQPDEDEMTHSHCLNSAIIAGIFADWLHLSANDKNTLILCGFFYDIGKLNLPYDILWKPDKLTDLEYAQVKTHPLVGYDMIKIQKNIDPHIVNAVLMHHERCDGTGYPTRLTSNQIDIFAKYIAIIDAYEAMTSPRIYRKSLSPLQVLEKFEESGIGKYDDAALRPIMKRIADTQIGMPVKLSDESEWEVFVINQSHYSRPILKRGESEFLDLLQRKDLSIVSNI